MEAKIRSKEFGIVDLFREGWKVYFANIKTILAIVLCIYIPIDLVLAFVPQNTRLYNLVLNLLQFLVGIIATLGIAIVTEKAIDGQSMNFFWDYVVALRDQSGRDALNYSKNLVEGQWWRIFGTTLVFSLIAIAISSGIWYLTSLISENQLFSIIPNILVDIVGSFITVMYVLLFLNSDFVKRPQPIEYVPSIEAL